MEFKVDVSRGKARRNDGMGFQKPTSEEQQSAMAKITKVGDNMYRVPSISKEDQTYLVDMDSGFCKCKTGMNVSPCKHLIYTL
jgi:hypothetical protein